jgi:hypothetical protein
MSNETPQQANMFTGAWEAKRTHAPKPQQTAMFTLRETFEFGVKAHPRFDDSRTPALQLIREDVRTLEEIERDLMRAAEQLTQPMFTGEGSDRVDAHPSHLEVDDEDEPAQFVRSVNQEEVTKRSCYLALIAIAHEKTATLWVDHAYRRRFNAQLPQAMFAAQAAGLTAAEIDAAIQIGEFKGRKEQESMPIIYETVPDIDDTPLALHSPMVTTRKAAPYEGFRAKLRYERAHIRTRHLQPKLPEEVSEFWMERDYMQSERIL